MPPTRDDQRDRELLEELASGRRALRRYRIERGRYPDTLSALAPTYVASVPIDPFTGAPPLYFREGTGFRLEGKNDGSFQRSKSAVLDWAVPK